MHAAARQDKGPLSLRDASDDAVIQTVASAVLDALQTMHPEERLEVVSALVSPLPSPP